MDAASKTQNLVLEVTWAGTEGDSVDSGDTGLQGKKITVPVTLIAKQVVGTTQQP